MARCAHRLRAFALGELVGFAEDAEDAESRGWPVRRLTSHHLAPATDPDPVADAIAQVLTEMPA